MASVYIAQRKPYTLAVMVYNGLELKTLTRRQVSAMVVLGGGACVRGRGQMSDQCGTLFLDDDVLCCCGH